MAVFHPKVLTAYRKWQYGHGWVERLSASSAKALAIADMTGDGNLNLVASFASGTWYYDSRWVLLSGSTARALAGDNDFLYASFDSGTWEYNGGWEKLSVTTAQTIAIADIAGSRD